MRTGPSVLYASALAPHGRQPGEAQPARSPRVCALSDLPPADEAAVGSEGRRAGRAGPRPGSAPTASTGQASRRSGRTGTTGPSSTSSWPRATSTRT
ncbi:MAG: hypothetical protein MZU97_12550 [Bacillus subtilis]|nr:hypothetical protein [Bacillus subtilis]